MLGTATVRCVQENATTVSYFENFCGHFWMTQRGLIWPMRVRFGHFAGSGYNVAVLGVLALGVVQNLRQAPETINAEPLSGGPPVQQEQAAGVARGSEHDGRVLGLQAAVDVVGVALKKA